MPKLISFKERKPEPGKYIVLRSQGDAPALLEVMEWHPSSYTPPGWWVPESGSGSVREGITHWCPIPEALRLLADVQPAMNVYTALMMLAKAVK